MSNELQARKLYKTLGNAEVWIKKKCGNVSELHGRVKLCAGGIGRFSAIIYLGIVSQSRHCYYW